jgi:hypothetical protein
MLSISLLTLLGGTYHEPHRSLAILLLVILIHYTVYYLPITGKPGNKSANSATNAASLEIE